MKFRLGTEREYINPLWVILVFLIILPFLTQNFKQTIFIIGVCLLACVAMGMVAKGLKN